MASAQDEVAGLDRVLTRLAMTDDEKLEGVLQKLIPAVLGTLRSPHDATRKKVMEVMAHVNKRVKGHTSLKLPLQQLVQLSHDDNPMVRSFALVYSETAMERASKEERLGVVGPLLDRVSTRAEQQKLMCLRLAVAGLEGLQSPSLPGVPNHLSIVTPAPPPPPPSPSPNADDDDESAPTPSATPAANNATSLGPAMSAQDAAWAAVVQQYPFLGRSEDRAAFLQFAMKLLLFVPRTTSPAQQQAQQQQQQFPGPFRIMGIAPPPPPQGAAPPPPPPPGLSEADLHALMDKVPAAKQQAMTESQQVASRGIPGKELPSGNVLIQRKLGILNFLEGAWPPPREVLLLLVVAACDPYDVVSRRGEELQKKLCSTDGSRPAVNLEQDEGVLRDAFALFHGNASGVLQNAALPEAQRTQAASPAVRSRILSLLCKCVAAANMFPQNILTIQESVFGSGSSMRLKAQGMEYSVWVCKFAAQHQLKAMAPAVLQGLLGTLERGGDLAASPEAMAGAPLPTDHTSVTLRGFAYQATGALVQRVPESLAGRLDVAHQFFTALSVEPPGLRATVAEAASCLSAAFMLHTLSHQQASELIDLLLASISAHQDAVRLCAVQWANRLFPPDHVPARWICVLAASDSKLEVRDEGSAGLHLDPITLDFIEPVPLKPQAPEAHATSTEQPRSGGTAQAAHEPMAVDSEGRASVHAAQGIGASSTASAAALASARGTAAAAAAAQKRPDLVSFLRYAAGACPALLPPGVFGAGRSAQAAAASAAAAAMQRAQGGVQTGLVTNDGEQQQQQQQGEEEAMFGVSPSVAPMPDPARTLPLKPRSYLALMRFAHQCLAHQLAQQQQQQPQGAAPVHARVPGVYLTLLEGAMTRDATSELTVAALQEVLDVVEVVPAECEQRLSTRVPWLCGFLSHVDSRARVAAAKLVGVASAALEPQAVQQLLASLTANFGTDSTATTPAPGTTNPSAVRAAAPPKFETQEGSVMATGCVLFHCLTGRPSLDTPSLQPHTSALLATAASHKTALIASTAALAIGHASLSHKPLSPLLQLTQGLHSQGNTDEGSSAASASAAAASAAQTSSAALAAAAAAAPGTSQGAGSAVEAAADAMRSRIAKEAEAEAIEAAERACLDEVVGAGMAALVRQVLQLMGSRDVKVAVRAVHAAGYLAWGCTEGEAGEERAGADPLLLRVLLKGVLKLAPQKNEEITFAAGEALAHIVGAVPVPRERVLRGNFTSLADEFALLTSSAPSSATPAPGAASMEVDGSAAGSAAEERAHSGEARQAVQQELLQRLLEDMVVHSRAEVRCSASVWLVSLLTYCGRHPALLPKLAEIQEALGGLLGDGNELTQEMASRGVSMVYALGDTEARSKLVESLVGVLQGTNTRTAKVKLQGETKVFEEGAIGSAPGGGSLSTYQELCSMATEVGQPDLVYKFMDLAHHQQALNTKRGAAFGFAGIARLVAGEALKPHVQKLLPRLYRYQYDPNPKVQEAMSGIWKALVDDPKAALTAALPTLMQDLIRELGGRLWRNRQAAAAALADLLQGRRWPELEPYFRDMWTMTFRAMDDIKDSVRNAASILARSLRGVTLRLVDPALSPPADAAAAVSVTLPLMIEQGLGSTVTEVRVLALDIIAQSTRCAVPTALKPLLPSLVQAMLEGLSSLEDSRLNYIEQHAERLGMDAERLDSMRTSAARASPLSETLDLCARIAGSDPSEGGALQTVLPTVASIIRHGVGLNTKTGAARFVRSMASRAGSTLRPHAPTLLKALTSATRNERSNTVRKAYAGAAALVCRYAAPKRVEWFVNTAVEMHKGGSGSAEGSGGDKDARFAAGLLLRELLRAAPEAFASQAASAALPVAFGAKMDDDKDVAAVWQEVWAEGSSSEAGAVRLYAAEIVALLVEGLRSQQWGRKQAAAQAVVQLTELGNDLLNGSGSASSTASSAPTATASAPSAGVTSGTGANSPACVLAEALFSESGGRLWDGKEAVLSALAALAKSAPGMLALLPKGGHARLVEAALAGMQRRKASYRKSAANLLQACLASFPSDFYDQVAPPLLSDVHAHCTPSATQQPPTHAATTGTAAPQQTPDDDAAAPLPPLPLIECLSCLAAAFARCTQPLGPAPALNQTSACTSSSSEAAPPAVPQSQLGPTEGVPPSALACGMPEVLAGDASRGAQLVGATAQVLACPFPFKERLATMNLVAAIAAKAQTLQEAGTFGGGAEGMDVDGAGTGSAAAPAAVPGVPAPVAGEATARWAAALVQGTAEVTADVAVQQVRSVGLNALEALLACVQSSASKTQLPSEVVARVLSSLQRLMENDRSVGVTATATRIRNQLEKSSSVL